jgi:site-specific recombinase XerD
MSKKLVQLIDSYRKSIENDKVKKKRKDTYFTHLNRLKDFLEERHEKTYRIKIDDDVSKQIKSERMKLKYLSGVITPDAKKIREDVESKWKKTIKDDFRNLDITDSKIHPRYFIGYENNRKVKPITLKEEQRTIRRFYKWCYENKHIQNEYDIKFSEENDFKKGKEYFTLPEYLEIVDYIKKWDKEPNLSPEEIELRKFIKEFILVMSNTGLSVGECKNLKWIQFATNPQRPFQEDEVSFITENKREVRGRCGSVFRRLYTKLSKHTNRDDYVFVQNQSGERITDMQYYRLWEVIVSSTPNVNWNIKRTYHNLRYFFLYIQYHSGVDIEELIKQVGISFRYFNDLFKDRKTKKLFRPLSKEQKEFLLKDTL